MARAAAGLAGEAGVLDSGAGRAGSPGMGHLRHAGPGLST